MLLLLACAGPSGDDTATAATLAPSERGPWEAGTAEDTLVGESGVELTVQAWFPAEGGSGAYAYDDFLEGSALDGATPACDGVRPVLVFSHGNSGVRYQSIFLTEHLASRGWIVVAPDHTGNTFFDKGTVPHEELILRRPQDIADSFDWLIEVAAAPGGLLEGCVDADAGYAVGGHSFGGYTTLAVAGATLDVAASAAYCAEHDEWLCDEFATVAGAETSFDLGDDRTWAAVPMSPAGHEVLVGGLAHVAIPTLIQSGTLDTLTPLETQVRPSYEGLTVEPRMLAALEGAGHFTYSDACAMVPTFDDCEPPYLAPEVAHPIITTTTTAFLEWVAGEDGARAWLPDPDEPLLTWTEAP